jgi:hypothetical protein
MDLGLISILITGGLAIMRVVDFFSSREDKADDKLSVFSKAADVKAQLEVITREMAVSNARQIKLDAKVQVLEERISNEIRGTGKALDELNANMDDLLRGGK